MVDQIMGEDYDDLAQLMGADLIVLGTAVVGEVKTGSTFYAGSTALLTGSGTQTLNPANENVPAGYYATTTLSAVDGDLAVGNIKSGVTIFGFAGTVLDTLTNDEQIMENSNVTPDSEPMNGYLPVKSVAGGGDLDPLVTKAGTYTAGSLALAGYWGWLTDSQATCKLRLWMGGVQVAESAQGLANTQPMEVFGQRALSGAQTCKTTVHNYGGPASNVGWVAANLNDNSGCMCLMVMSVKNA